jgi:hypothetical protein
MGPVFLFGTGRSGTTHLQRLITLNTEVWVWGEHDGFLEPLLKGLIAYEDSRLLSKNVFDRPLLEDDDQLIDLVQRESGGLAWLNRLRRSDLRVELRKLIERLFSRGIPQGYTSWGFKELRYGYGPNKIPAHLLDLFPECSMAFIFREPSANIASQLRNWHKNWWEPERLSELPRLYEEVVRYWVEAMENFIGFKKTRPDSIVMLEMRQLNGPPEQILKLLRLRPRSDIPCAVASITNQGRPSASLEADRAMAICFERWRVETTALYEAALALCDVLP